MTPQEISDYKMRWMREAGHAVRIHSDLTDTAKLWCKQCLHPYQWSVKLWTAVYEHTFYFEKSCHANLFKYEFAKWVNQ